MMTKKTKAMVAANFSQRTVDVPHRARDPQPLLCSLQKVVYILGGHNHVFVFCARGNGKVSLVRLHVLQLVSTVLVPRQHGRPLRAEAGNIGEFFNPMVLIPTVTVPKSLDARRFGQAGPHEKKYVLGALHPLLRRGQDGRNRIIRR